MSGSVVSGQWSLVTGHFFTRRAAAAGGSARVYSFRPTTRSTIRAMQTNRASWPIRRTRGCPARRSRQRGCRSRWGTGADGQGLGGLRRQDKATMLASTVKTLGQGE